MVKDGGRMINPESNDGDYVEMLTQGSRIELTKKEIKHGLKSDVSVGSKMYGKIKNSVRVGRIIEFIDGAGSTSRVERVDVSPDSAGGNIADIIVHTKTSVYELKVLDNQHRHISLKFWRNGYLDFEDKMPDGFYSGDMFAKIGGKGGIRLILPEDSYVREIIRVDQKRDHLLNKKVDDISKIVLRERDAKKRAMVLSKLIDENFGGHPKSITRKCEENIKKLIKENPRMKEDFRLGYLDFGTCRHRSILFKYIADRVGIRARLLRGGLPGKGRHRWNVVEVDGKKYLVDAMNYPGELREFNDPNIPKFQRENGVYKLIGGLGGDSIPVKKS